MRSIDYKVPGGKLLRLKARTENGRIEEIKINGDFFVYPETAIEDIEIFLNNQNIADLADRLNRFIKEKNIRIIGFTPADLEQALAGK